MFESVIQNTIMITSFVLVMMLIIEYVNVQTRGAWSKPLRKSGFVQVIVASFLGMIPGCLGTYTVVSLYTHNLIGFGALVAAMIATSGDEAFFMFSMIPETAIILSLIIFVIAIVVGLLVMIVFKRKNFVKDKNFHLEIHDDEHYCSCFQPQYILPQLRNISFHRAILLAGALLFIFGLITGTFSHDHNNRYLLIGDSHNHETEQVHIHSEDCNHSEVESIEEQMHTEDCNHNHEAVQKTETHSVEATHDHSSHDHEHGQWNWFTITFLIISLIALFIILTVPDHFLTHHLWGHIIKKHFLKIFLWTFGALLAIGLLMEYTDFTSWIGDKHIYVLIAAVLIGIIPESGPHLLFVSLFITGGIPFSVLLANSIVQDGHGALPLFAESKRSFFMMKLINVAVGFLVGIIGLYAGF